MGALLTDNYLEFAATQDRVNEMKQQARAAVKAFQRKREQGTGDVIAQAIAERGVMLPPPETAGPFTNDVCGSPSESLNLDLYGKVMAERLRLRLMAAEKVEAQ
jgi:hypothetical protein